MPLERRALVIAVLLAACGGKSDSDDEETGTTGPAADDTTESSSTGHEWLECEDALIDDIALELTILPPFTPTDDMGVQYSGACEVSGLDTSEPTIAVLDFACTGEGGPSADWTAKAKITWTGGTLPLQLAPGSMVDLTLVHADIDTQLDSIGVHVEGDLVFAASTGQVLESAVGGEPQSVWSPMHVDAPPDQMCEADPDGCTARNRLVFDGLTGTAIDVFDHHAVATGSYDILVGRAMTHLLDVPCDGNAGGWYDFIVLRTGG